MKIKILMSKLGIGFTAVALLLSITAFFTLNKSAAWYNQNKVVYGNGMAVGANDDAGKIRSVEFFSIAAVELTEKTLGESREYANTYLFFTQKIEENEDVLLRPHSSLDPQRQLLMKITLNTSEYFVIDANTTVSYSEFPLPKDEDAFSVTENSLASVVQFSVVDPSLSIKPTERVINGKNESCYVIDDFSFIQGEPDESGKTAPLDHHFSEITYGTNSITASMSNSVELYSGENVRELFVVIDYYEDAAEYFRDQVSPYLMNIQDFDMSSTPIGFKSDFVFNIK